MSEEPSRDPIREPGWYRLTDKGWLRVTDATAEIEVASGGGFDMVKVEFTYEDVPLW